MAWGDSAKSRKHEIRALRPKTGPDACPAAGPYRLTPNQLTAVSLLLALAAAGLFALGDSRAADWAAGLFVLARFLDHFDGELARLTGRATRFGYYFDYATGGASFAALFLGLGIGFSGGPLGAWAILLGAGGAAAAILSMVLNLELDQRLDLRDGEAVGYPGVLGFELEDGVYLLAPITWLGWLMPFFVAAGIGATVYCGWTLARVIRAGRGGRGRTKGG